MDNDPKSLAKWLRRTTGVRASTVLKLNRDCLVVNVKGITPAGCKASFSLARDLSITDPALREATFIAAVSEAQVYFGQLSRERSSTNK